MKHLQNVQRQQLSQAVATDPHTLHKFKAGFNECASEVSIIGSACSKGVFTSSLLRKAYLLSTWHGGYAFHDGPNMHATPTNALAPFRLFAGEPVRVAHGGSGRGGAAAAGGPPLGLRAGAAATRTLLVPRPGPGPRPGPWPGPGARPGPGPHRARHLLDDAERAAAGRSHALQRVQLQPPATASCCDNAVALHVVQVQLSGDINNNNNVSSRVQSLQLIPSRLPTGELALLLPNSATGQLSSAGLLFPAAAAATPGSTTADAIKASPLSPRSPHASAFTAVGSLSVSALGALGSVAATPPASDAASASASAPGSATGSASSSPDTPPSSARALQLARVAADSSTSSSPESASSPSLAPGPRAHGRASPITSSSGLGLGLGVEVKLEPKQEPQDVDASATPRTPLAAPRGPRAASALDFSLKRCTSDSSETEAEAEAEGAPPAKLARYTLSVTSAPATSTGLVGPFAPPLAVPAAAMAAVGPGHAGHALAALGRPLFAAPVLPTPPALPALPTLPALQPHDTAGHEARDAHEGPEGPEGDRDMWRPW